MIGNLGFHISKFPSHSWSVILQQAWSMCLKDKIHGTQSEDNRPPGGHGSSKKPKINEPFRRYNKGKCTYGSSCRYEHRCSIPKLDMVLTFVGSVMIWVEYPTIVGQISAEQLTRQPRLRSRHMCDRLHLCSHCLN